MKKWLIFLAVLALPASAHAQVLAQGSLTSTTVNPCVVATSLNQGAAVNIQVTGTYSGTITFKGFSDIGRTFTEVTATNTSGFATGTTTTGTGIFTVTNTGYSQIEACMTAYSSGGAYVTITRGFGAGGSGSVGSGSSVTINDPSVTTQKAAVNASGQLSITCANCSGSGASAVDEAPFTLGSGSFAPAGGFFQTTATNNALTTGQGGLVQMTAQRALFSNLRQVGGSEIGVTANPLFVTLASTGANATAVKVDNSAVTQPVSNAGTFAVQAAATLNAETTKVIGTTRNLGNAGAILDFAGQNASSPANSWLIGGQFNTSPTTITSGNSSPLQLDNAGNLNVNIKAGAGSGGTALADNAAFTQSTTSETPVAGLASTNDAAYASATNGHATIWQMTTKGHGIVDVSNANANGSAVSASSSPVVIASDQAAVAVKAASGAIASGAIASGAVASGAFGSDSASFGVSATGAAPPAKAVFASGLGAGATGGFLLGIPVCDSSKSVSMTSATTTLMVTGVSGRQVRICGLNLVTGIANNVALIEGTGATCGTGTAGMAGGSTAANGWNFAANGGLTLGGGIGTVIATATTGDSVCIITSATGPLAGTISYTIY